MISRRNAIQPKRPTAATATLERSRLEQERTLALRRRDAVKYDRIQAELLMLGASAPATNDVENERATLLAQVSGKNDLVYVSLYILMIFTKSSRIRCIWGAAQRDLLRRLTRAQTLRASTKIETSFMSMSTFLFGLTKIEVMLGNI